MTVKAGHESYAARSLMILDQGKRVFVLVVAALSSFASPIRAQSPPREAPPVVAGCPEYRFNLLKVANHCARYAGRDSNCPAHQWAEPYALAKDSDLRKKSHAYLIIPTARVTGIEDSQILSKTYDNLWIDGWHSSHNLGQHTEWTGLAINSCYNRGEDQLHIHVSCVDPKLAKKLPTILDYPQFKTVNLKDHKYEATKVSGLTGDNNPFKVVEQRECANAGTDLSACMAKQSIAVIGPGDAEHDGHYYVLNNPYAGPHTRTGHAEELLDQNCSAR